MAKKPLAPLITEEGSVATIFEKGTHFQGILEFEKPLQINGEFEGEIRSSGVLVIGEGARVKANIRCNTVIVGGTVIGNIEALKRIESVHLVSCDAIAPHGFLQDGIVVAVFDDLIHVNPYSTVQLLFARTGGCGDMSPRGVSILRVGPFAAAAGLRPSRRAFISVCANSAWSPQTRASLAPIARFSVSGRR